jgi:hypothetical protein
MKKVFLITVFALLSFNVFAQQKINITNLLGYWKPDQESAELFFWKDADDKLQTQGISSTSGKQIDVITLRINDASIFIRTIFIPNNWVTENVYTFIDNNTLKCVVTGDGEGTIIYKKVK